MTIFRSKALAAQVITLMAALCLNGQALSQTFDPPLRKYKSGNELYEACSTTEGHILHWSSQAECIGYITGVIDLHNTLVGLNTSKRNVCPRQGVTVGQMKDVVTKWMRENPEDRHLTAALFVLIALKESFPCDE